MGGVCSFCDPNASKNDGDNDSGKNAFVSNAASSDALLGESIMEKGSQARLSNQLLSNDEKGTQVIGDSANVEAMSKEALERQKQAEMELIKEQQRALREKQRLDTIISTAGRDMIAIHRRDGYYDPREAAMVASNLHPTLKETTTPGASTPESQFSSALPKVGYIPQETDFVGILSARLPWTGGSAMDTPSDPQQEWSWLVGQPGVATGCTHISMHLDDMSEAYLKRILPPTKEQFGAGLGPMVEDLP
jgi:hypothetical protein